MPWNLAGVGVFDEEGLFRVEILSKVRERLEKSKNGDGSFLRTHAKGRVHGWVAERMVRCAEKMVGSDLPPKIEGREARTSPVTTTVRLPTFHIWWVGR